MEDCDRQGKTQNSGKQSPTDGNQWPAWNGSNPRGYQGNSLLGYFKWVLLAITFFPEDHSVYECTK